jgi:surface carbohydrate biosynthesis protein
LWGDYQKKLLKKLLKKKYFKKLHVTGNPKYEIYQKEYTKYFYKKYSNFKNYILVNSNFSSPFSKFQTLQKDQSDHTNPKFMSIIQQDSRNRAIIFCKYILQLASIHKNELFIIRNHPFEDSGFHKKFFSKIKNIKVFNKENLLTQLLDCKFMIHSNCSTSVDSFLLKKKSIFIDLSQKSSHKYNTFLFKKISYFVKNFSNLNKIFLQLNSKNFKDKNKEHEYQKKIIDNCFNTSSYSISDNIKNIIGNLNILY